ncbi:SDR family oxidoreductase [Zavarzinia sp.]|uniref:SDR family oxidoreductase n=1 Tax=Zavarzinia sp. TaxID=2027920 RepID=UPI003BB811E0
MKPRDAPSPKRRSGAWRGFRLLEMTRRRGIDLQDTGIHVNVLSPAPTRTELALDVVGEETLTALCASTPIGRVADPSETAAVAAFLASADSSFMTGGEVFADGGFAQV